MSDDLRDLYQDLILDHGKNPRNFKALDGAQCEAVGHNPFCGDKLILYVKVDAQGKIAEATFQGSGCAISTASASMMTDMLRGKTAVEARALIQAFESLCHGHEAAGIEKLTEDDRDRLLALAGVKDYPVRVKCAMLAWRTLEQALDPAVADREAKTE
jgi:nitrogen fixation NifU-like protein